jgi:hypothetical protein
MSGFDFEVEIFKKKFQAKLGNFLAQKMRANKRSALVVFSAKKSGKKRVLKRREGAFCQNRHESLIP